MQDNRLDYLINLLLHLKMQRRAEEEIAALMPPGQPSPQEAGDDSQDVDYEEQPQQPSRQALSAPPQQQAPQAAQQPPRKTPPHRTRKAIGNGAQPPQQHYPSLPQGNGGGSANYTDPRYPGGS